MKKIEFKTLLAASAVGLSMLACSALSGASGLSSTEEPTVQSTSPAPENTPTDAPPPPASGHIAFISARDGKKKLYMMNADGSGQWPLTSGDSEEESPAWSPDGTRI